jgi:hypothetical protein
MRISPVVSPILDPIFAPSQPPLEGDLPEGFERSRGLESSSEIQSAWKKCARITRGFPFL